MSHHYKSSAGDNNNASKKKKQHRKKSSSLRALPRKCAIIRRSFVNGIEKTELRFVAYNRVGGEESGGYNDRGFLADVDEFLQEQIRGSSDAESVSYATTSTTNADGAQTPPSSADVSVLSAASSNALASTHHEPKCAKSKFVKDALPSLERLVKYYKEKSKKTADLQMVMLKMTAEDVLADAQRVLMEGGVPMDALLKRIEVLNIVEEKKK